MAEPTKDPLSQDERELLKAANDDGELCFHLDTRKDLDALSSRGLLQVVDGEFMLDLMGRDLLPGTARQRVALRHIYRLTAAGKKALEWAP